MTPQDAIDMLDAALAEAKETISLKRLIEDSDPLVAVGIPAKISGYAPEQLVGDVTQQDFKFIISPTGISAAGWPGTTQASTGTDPRIPGKPDVIITSRGQATVQSARGIFMNDVLVRIEGTARGEM